MNLTLSLIYPLALFALFHLMVSSPPYQARLKAELKKGWRYLKETYQVTDHQNKVFAKAGGIKKDTWASRPVDPIKTKYRKTIHHLNPR